MTMLKFQYWYLIITVSYLYLGRYGCNAAALKQLASVQEVEEVLDKIPVERRKGFLKEVFALALQYKSLSRPHLLVNHLVDNIIEMERHEIATKYNTTLVEPGLALKILEIAQQEYELTDSDIEQYCVYNVVYFSTGWVDPGDIGSLCCPFRFIQNKKSY